MIFQLHFDGLEKDRGRFLLKVRRGVYEFTDGDTGFCILMMEIAKNIFDHAGGKGSLTLMRVGKMFEFEIKDEGTQSHDYEKCRGQSSLRGNGINFGVGLDAIPDMAKTLGIDLKIDCSRGFCYSGTYTPSE
jgi:hypothetical protein